MTPALDLDPFASVVGQDAAVTRLRAAVASPVHAYLFVGPPGSGKRAAALAFAGAVLGTGKNEADAERDLDLATAGRHPDVVLIEPEGQMFRGGYKKGDPPTEATLFIREMLTSPREGSRKVVVADQFHTVNNEGVGRLLKVVEEPPASSVAILLADSITPELTTIVSRCVEVDFTALEPHAIREQLEAEGVPADEAELAAKAAGGSLDRARLLTEDRALAARWQTWWDLPVVLDGSGAAVATAVDDLRARIDEAQQSLDERQARELEELEARVEQFGERGAGRRSLKERHAREQRKLRTDELLFGFATVAARYRDELARAETYERAHPTPADLTASLDAVQHAAESFEFNPNETLLLQRLLLSLTPLPAT